MNKFRIAISNVLHNSALTILYCPVFDTFFLIVFCWQIKYISESRKKIPLPVSVCFAPLNLKQIMWGMLQPIAMVLLIKPVLLFN